MERVVYGRPACARRVSTVFEGRKREFRWSARRWKVLSSVARKVNVRCKRAGETKNDPPTVLEIDFPPETFYRGGLRRVLSVVHVHVP